MLGDNLEGCAGVGDGRKVWEGGDTCIPVVDSCWCMAETNTILQSNYLVFKFFWRSSFLHFGAHLLQLFKTDFCI